VSDFNETLLSAWVGKHGGWNILQISPFVNNFVAGKQQQAALLQPRLTTDQLSSLHHSSCITLAVTVVEKSEIYNEPMFVCSSSGKTRFSLRLN
jgi:hypothetical protein